MRHLNFGIVQRNCFYRDFFSYELAPLFDESGKMRKTSKLVLIHRDKVTVFKSNSIH